MIKNFRKLKTKLAEKYNVFEMKKKKKKKKEKLMDGRMKKMR